MFTSADVSVTVCMKGSHFEGKMTLLSLACFSCHICWKLLHSVVSGKRWCCKKRNRFPVNLTSFMLKILCSYFSPWFDFSPCGRLFTQHETSDGDCLTCRFALHLATFLTDLFYCPGLYTNTNTFTFFLFVKYTHVFVGFVKEHLFMKLMFFFTQRRSKALYRALRRNKY